VHSVLCYGPARSGQGQLLPLASPRVGRAPGDAEGETGLGTISFSFSANTDRDYEEKESLWEYAHHHQEHTRIFNGVPGVTPAKIIDKM